MAKKLKKYQATTNNKSNETKLFQARSIPGVLADNFTLGLLGKDVDKAYNRLLGKYSSEQSGSAKKINKISNSKNDVNSRRRKGGSIKKKK
jgi:hypothetical protein